MKGNHSFLLECYSRPKMLSELKVGDLFIRFPDDGDDSGRGGFKGGCRLLEKIEPFHPGEGYHKSFLYTYKNYETKDVGSLPSDYYVIQVHGVK